MLNQLQLINLVHIVFVGPLLILMATNSLNQMFNNLVILLAIIIMIYHSYLLYKRSNFSYEMMDNVNGNNVHYIKLYDSHPGYDRPIINIKEGEVVVWTNIGSVEHSVTEKSNEFNSGYMKPGDSFSRKFNVKGEYEYYSMPQRGWMFGKVIVS